MKFFSRELSQALQEAGCVSVESQSIYDCTGKLAPVGWCSALSCKLTHQRPFGWWDLCGGSERARENAKKWWGDGQHWYISISPGIDGTWKSTHEIKTWQYNRHALIDLPEEEQEKYVWETMKGAV